MWSVSAGAMLGDLWRSPMNMGAHRPGSEVIEHEQPDCL
jgi:hypothetical protein